MDIRDDNYQYASDDINAIHYRIGNGTRALTSDKMSTMFGDTSTTGTIQVSSVNLTHCYSI